MIYINVVEMCFIPMNVHNELFNGVRQLRWQHLSPVVSTFYTYIRLLSSFFIKPCILPLSSSLFLSLRLSSLSVVPHPVFLISGLSLRFGYVEKKHSPKVGDVATWPPSGCATAAHLLIIHQLGVQRSSPELRSVGRETNVLQFRVFSKLT